MNWLDTRRDIRQITGTNNNFCSSLRGFVICSLLFWRPIPFPPSNWLHLLHIRHCYPINHNSIDIHTHSKMLKFHNLLGLIVSNKIHFRIQWKKIEKKTNYYMKLKTKTSSSLCSPFTMSTVMSKISSICCCCCCLPNILSGYDLLFCRLIFAIYFIFSFCTIYIYNSFQLDNFPVDLVLFILVDGCYAIAWLPSHFLYCRTEKCIYNLKYLNKNIYVYI